MPNRFKKKKKAKQNSQKLRYIYISIHYTDPQFLKYKSVLSHKNTKYYKTSTTP